MAKFVKQDDDDGNQKNKNLYKDFFFHKEIKAQQARELADEDIEILSNVEDIIPYLQTALLEEHLIEVDIGQLTRDFFTQITDDEPNGNGIDTGQESLRLAGDQETGGYLKNSDFFLTSPLSPGMGNVSIRHYKSAILKYFTGTTSIELGCTLRQAVNAADKPCLMFDFPKVGRVLKGFRSFRVKVLSSVDAKVNILGHEQFSVRQDFQLEDISVSGVGFMVSGDIPPFEIGEKFKVRVSVEGCGHFEMNGVIRRVVPLRSGTSFNHICGMQFDLETGAMAKTVELMVTAVQRLHLRELAEKISGMSGVKIIR